MKTLSSFKATFLIPLVAFVVTAANAQDSKKDKQAAEAAATKNLLDTKRFVFQAQSTTPTGGKLIQLSFGFYLKVSGDTMISYLPYYGRSYSPTLPTENNGMNFTSTDFEYKIEDRKKGGWDVDIVPTDYTDVQKITLTVFENGNTSAQIISKSKSTINYSGYIVSPDKK